MKFYAVHGLVGHANKPRYEATLAEAHNTAKARAPEPVYRKEILIEEVEVPTDKNGVLSLLNQSDADHASDEDDDFFVKGRRWGLTARGALNEILIRGDGIYD